MAKKVVFEEEYVGEWDRAIYCKGREFPRIFMTNRFSDSGWNLYLVKSSEEYQQFLFNDEFMAIGSKSRPVATTKDLKTAGKTARELLKK